VVDKRREKKKTAELKPKGTIKNSHACRAPHQKWRPFFIFKKYLKISTILLSIDLRGQHIVVTQGRIVKANLSWSQTQAKSCQLFARLCSYLSFLCWKSNLRISSLSFISLSWSRITDKLAINWQNFARVRLQLKFAFNLLLIVFLNYFKKIQLKMILKITK